MKCPKCGYNSFELLDSCKKCHNDLTEFKRSLGIRSIVVPLRHNPLPTAHLQIEEPAKAVAPAEISQDMFEWSDPSEEDLSPQGPAAKKKPG